MAQAMTVSDIMTREVVTLFEEDNLERVSNELSHFRFRHLPVIDDGKLVGILSQRDLLRATLSGVEGTPMARAREARFLEETFVRDLMHTDVQTARPEETARVAAKRMLDEHIGALPVIDAEGMLVGIVTEHDIVRVASDIL
jgi:CBS-domain-containing membrane protein